MNAILEDTSSDNLFDADLAATLGPFFRTMHPLERYGKIEPQPSMFLCFICCEYRIDRKSLEASVVVGCNTANLRRRN